MVTKKTDQVETVAHTADNAYRGMTVAVVSEQGGGSYLITETGERIRVAWTDPEPQTKTPSED